ncbi:glutaredoxin [Pseudomonas psychrotolerans]|uniref:glutaredoxin family protein n=1 Tax=Pseudomonas TaxID=286 RepID=UPI000EBAD66C|nr:MULTISPECIES: glutathione S-transferase N-terminal domain-containing protein [Pseudomonas]EIO9964713.1 glutathione S-transferase N-terminal domain-containing protein [Listeria monocytogenes]HCV77395.1 glutaredoxin [Pseudomonas sp.]MBA1180119.1 glutaredoxin [Pseudomonas psychrotolerans]MBA1211233.1 glutaredoxin [Pseudomonas psychrotolerans]TCQ87260.1 glutaredoxin [Pseudomonas sp. JUb52]
MINLLRNGLGQVIVGLDLVTRPRKLKRTEQAQAAIEAELANLSLYQFQACPFCVKTRRALHRLNLPVRLKDIKKEPHLRAELEQGGGRVKVPCLRIDEGSQSVWMYESDDIIAYLEQRYGERQPA